jgi:energy-coupling factor transporter transmembrane protein EcfT
MDISSENVALAVVLMAYQDIISLVTTVVTLLFIVAIDFPIIQNAKFTKTSVILLICARITIVGHILPHTWMKLFKVLVPELMVFPFSNWYFDTGAFAQMTPNTTSLNSSEQYGGKYNLLK